MHLARVGHACTQTTTSAINHDCKSVPPAAIDDRLTSLLVFLSPPLEITSFLIISAHHTTLHMLIDAEGGRVNANDIGSIRILNSVHCFPTTRTFACRESCVDMDPIPGQMTDQDLFFLWLRCNGSSALWTTGIRSLLCKNRACRPKKLATTPLYLFQARKDDEGV